MTDVRITEYTLDAFPDTVNAGLWCVQVKHRGPDSWGVYWHGMCLNRRTMQWDNEPLSSYRTDKWKKTHRFPLERALELAHKVFPTIKVNSRLAMEINPEEWQ